ncbi:MAG: hypothetical protein IKK23_05010 [Bacteroidales bacterium]|nr:hypothetical protein [Bacteroidales bacterium]
MLIGKNSWKGLLLLIYVALTIRAAIGCFLANIPFFVGIGITLLLGNGYAAAELYNRLTL